MQAPTINLSIQLRRIERDIDVEKRLRKQKKRDHLPTTDVDERLAKLRRQANTIRTQMHGAILCE